MPITYKLYIIMAKTIYLKPCHKSLRFIGILTCSSKLENIGLVYSISHYSAKSGTTLVNFKQVHQFTSKDNKAAYNNPCVISPRCHAIAIRYLYFCYINSLIMKDHNTMQFPNCLLHLFISF